MFRPKEPIDWSSVWPDLLQGIGAGLLHYDDSRLAQAALLGLEAFDAAQARRRWQEPEMDAENHEQRARTPLWPGMSAAELAAFQRLSPEDQDAFRQEVAESDLPADSRDYEYRSFPGSRGHNRGKPDLRTVPLPFRPQPLSPSPFADWPLGAILPLERDGRLNIPTLRR
jgi:hypothetical protein